MKHLEMAEQLAAYKEMVEQLEEHPDANGLKLARSLPGAWYLVNTTFVREAWLKLHAELALLFPPEEEPAPAPEDH
jgi:hypothetical protein